jgi:hypothetical protein
VNSNLTRLVTVTVTTHSKEQGHNTSSCTFYPAMQPWYDVRTRLLIVVIQTVNSMSCSAGAGAPADVLYLVLGLQLLMGRGLQ